MIVSFIILTIVSFFFKVNAQEYIPYKNNPVIIKEPSHHGYVQPHILKEQGYFSIWFADNDGTRHRIVRMVSSNGIDWYDKKDTQVSERNNVHDPFIFFDKNEYVLFFASSNFGNISLWKSTSQDGITFVPGEESEILKSEVPWEGSHVSCPSVIKHDDVYYLFYAGSGVSNWGIGLATSLDGKKWQRCSNNPIIAPGASAEIIKFKDKFYLYFQSPNGLEVQETDSLNGCSTLWTNRHTIKNPLRDPSLVVVDDSLWMYGTHANNNSLHIGLASNTEMSIPKYPVIVIPGMFASWNSQAILHNEKVDSNKWILQPGVKEYDALDSALKNKMYTKGKDYYYFSYDWRQPISKTLEDFDVFLSDTIWKSKPYQPIQIIGHSLGGAISRQYIKKNPYKPIKKIVTVASPHYGALQAYKPLASGEIDRENTLMWIAEKLILLLNKTKIESDKETVKKVLPILTDLLPVFPYLKNNNGEFIQSIYINNTLSMQPFQSTISQLYLGSSNSKVNAGYILNPQTPLEKLTNTYADGHPHEVWMEDGDGVVLLKSTLNQHIPVSFLNHGETIFDKENLKIIFSSLGIDLQDHEILEGRETQIFPAILALIQSPATIKIEYGNSIENENEGMIWLQGAQNGTYKLTVTGIEDGEYTLSVWLIGENDDKWIQFKKTAKTTSQDVFTVMFDEKTGGVVHEYILPTSPSSPTTTPKQEQTKPQAVLSDAIRPSVLLNENSESHSNIDNISNETIKKINMKQSSAKQPTVLGVSSKQMVRKKINFFFIVLISMFSLTLISIYVYKRKYIDSFIHILLLNFKNFYLKWIQKK